MSYQDKLKPRQQRKLLALDGGGIRGAISIEILAQIEQLVRARHGEKLVLADYFDYVAGTSTGAIIATCIALGMSVKEIREFYVRCGPDMFTQAGLLNRLRYKFEDEPLAAKLKEVIGANTQFGDSRLRTLLMMVMRNATTDSPWPLSNNPAARYNKDATRADCNLHLPLWQLVRASTAAPTYFPPEQIPVGENTFVFVDGGITMYNNPAFQLFLMATAEPYRLQWPAAEDRMLLVSIGTGTSPGAKASLKPSDMHLLYNASSIPSALMNAALNEQDLLCRMFGRCLAGDPIDREVGDLIGTAGPVKDRLFTYVRYNATLTTEGLQALGLGHIRPADVQMLDSTAALPQLQEIGRTVAAKDVVATHFAAFGLE